MENFISENPKKVVIQGIEFSIREMNGREYDAAANEYLSITEDNRFSIDVAKRNEIWLKLCVVDSTVETIKPFKDLTVDEKIKLLQNLKPAIRLSLIKEIRILNEMESDLQKN